MKKLIVFALLFGVITGSAFAQLTFSGDFHAGIQIEIPYDTNDEHSPDRNTVYPLHRTEGFPVFNFVAAFNRPIGGARLDTSFQTDLAGNEALTVNGVYGWVNFLDNTLQLTVGRMSNPRWVASLDPDHIWHFDEITGLRLEYHTPLPGLSVGAAFRTEGNDLQELFKRVIFGANFTHRTFNAVFAYNLGSNGHALFSINYFGITDLTLGVQTRIRHIASWNTRAFGGSVEVVQRAGFRVTRLMELTLLAGQIFYAEPSGGERRDPALFFTPGVSYRLLPDLTASFSIEVRSDDLFDRSRFITFNPAIEYNVGGPISFYAEYEFVMANYVHQSLHRISLGINIRAF